MSTIVSRSMTRGRAPNRSARLAVALAAPSARVSITWQRVSGAALVVIACTGIAACATSKPYNPDHLSTANASQVGKICQTTMRLQPSEELTENLWPGDPDSASETNDYRGCVATLSNSLELAAAAGEASQAERECRAKGLRDGSPQSAVCVLTVEEAQQALVPQQLPAISVAPFLQQTTVNSDDHVPESLRRAQLACAEIGLDPNHGVFNNCVQGLSDVMSASFMDEGYRN